MKKHAFRDEVVTPDERKLMPVKMDQLNLGGKFTGYASLFGQVDQANDRVERGAFSKSLKRRGANGVRMLFQHDPEQPIGVWHEISEDDHGLRVCGQIVTSTPKGAEVLELMKAGALDGLSIGFRTERARTDSKTGIRHILSADLWEISIVTFPMLETARVQSLKSALAADGIGKTYPSLRKFEQWLMQDAGLARKDARIVIREGYARLVGKPGAARPGQISDGALVSCIRRATRALGNSH